MASGLASMPSSWTCRAAAAPSMVTAWVMLHVVSGHTVVHRLSTRDMTTATRIAATATGAPRTSATTAGRAGTVVRLLRRVVTTEAGQRGAEFRPREDRRVRVASARQAGGIEDDPHAPVAQPGHAGQEQPMARERDVPAGRG